MKMIRKMTALLLALCVALGAVSCSTADQSWSAEKDGDRLPVGVYVYNLYAAISLAQTQDGVDTSANLLEQEIDGQPAEVLVRASDTAEVLVIGSRGRGGFAGLLLGSTSQSVLPYSQCPTMVVRVARDHGRRKQHETPAEPGL